MGGVGLSRLWASHPRLAFVLHLVVTLMIGGFALSLIFSRAGWGSILVLVIGFVVMAGSLVLLTWFAMKDHWQPDDYSTTNAAPLPSMRDAWGGAKAAERVLWVFFAAAFLGGLVLLVQRSVVGFALVVICIPLAIVAVRAGR
jgi:hypothetical protein